MTRGVVCTLALLAGGALQAARLNVARLDVGVVDAGTSTVSVAASADFAAGLSVRDDAVLVQGISYLEPADGLPMGPFTNVATTSAGTPCPSWWREQGVLDPARAPNDYAAATQGQVKWIASAGCAALAAAGATQDGCGPEIVARVAAFTPASNDCPVTLGQLKNVAAPFWARLGELGAVGEDPPWQGRAGDDFALVAVGQVKRAFNFDVRAELEDVDGDGDGTPDDGEGDHGRDPYDPADGGHDTDTSAFCEIAVKAYGDGVAEWDLVIEGLGPDDWRVERHSITIDDMLDIDSLQVRRGNAYRFSLVWKGSVELEHEPEKKLYPWSLQIGDFYAARTFNHVSRGRYVRNECDTCLANFVGVIDNRDGLVTSSCDPESGDGGNLAEGRTATLYVMDDPQLSFDYDRDGTFSEMDRAQTRAGKVFRFWQNDDFDAGDICPAEQYLWDGPGFAKERGPSNGADDVVNGRRDLLDFVPVWLDVNAAFPASTPYFLKTQIVWRIEGPVNVVWTSLDRRTAGDYRTKDVSGCGVNLNRLAHEADVSRLDLRTPPSFLGRLLSRSEGGVFLVEGGKTENGTLRVVPEVGLVGHPPKVGASCPMVVTGMDRMCRWLDLRDAVLGGRPAPLPSEPTNRPDAECDGRNIVFVHGFNINPDEERAASYEMFKRLWQAGSKAMFTSVGWYGYEGQVASGVLPEIADGTFSLNYYANVVNAFQTAPAFAARCAALPGRKTVIAHSLGNMLVSSAAVDHGLVYDRYYMLNAAVAQEAYNEDLSADPMVDQAWEAVQLEYRASGWHRLFGADDFRNSLTWRNRFRGLRNAVNLHSATDSVLANGNLGQPMLAGSVWRIQERTKGASILHLLNHWKVACEGGWGISTSYSIDPLSYIPFQGFRVAVNDFTRQKMIGNPLFTPFRFMPDEMMSTNLLVISDVASNAYCRAKFLADAIPATSFAMGANAINGAQGIENRDLADYAGENWPRMENGTKIWDHSDFKNIAYFFMHRLFEEMVD